MTVSTYVKTYNEIHGTHLWEQAPQDVYYLGFPHRHTFCITTEFEVKDMNREIEIFTMEKQIEDYIKAKYATGINGLCYFGSMSCEMIAAEILEVFSAVRCEVNEDGKGGAIVVRG